MRVKYDHDYGTDYLCKGCEEPITGDELLDHNGLCLACLADDDRSEDEAISGEYQDTLKVNREYMETMKAYGVAVHGNEGVVKWLN